MTTPAADPSAIDAFIARWAAAGGTERANYQIFVGELCALLDLPAPEPARDDSRDNGYVYERRVDFHHGDGSESLGFIDCYRRQCFVLEAKKLKTTGKGFDDALQRARGRAEQYARALPADEGRPPFVVIVDVGNVIELYAEFSRSGATYTPFPDPRSHRIRLADLRDDKLRERLVRVWNDPLSLDPARATARVTRAVAASLAEVAQVLEAAGHAPEAVAGFLTRCLFSMFAEDVGLLPRQSFSELLASLAETPAQFVPLVGELWRAMDRGEFSVAIRAALPRFNGKLFKEATVLPLDREQIGLLRAAAGADWTQVEPAIFGTLLERALHPDERHALGAHYTPRSYVERLVLPTVIEPLREEWGNVQAAALLLAAEGKSAEAARQIAAFQHRLCTVRVLDPACGSGNFLYVTLEHMKRLEGEVLNQLHDFSQGQHLLETEGLTVDPHQFLGLEINPRAAAIAELVLWIGYLQWHFRTRGSGLPPQPVLRDFRNIECRDAVLASDRVDYVLDDHGIPVSRWDGRTMKTHPVTGEDVPDEAARTPLERYVNPRPAAWPQADYVVGNPPFIGNKRMRLVLGDGYVDALRGAWKGVPESADFVMFWWNKAAQLVRENRLARFGFITTNSITQAFNRRVLERHLGEIQLAFAVPDHPWVDSADGAAVRIAMTVATPGKGDGRLLTVTAENVPEGDAVHVEFSERIGGIHADLTVGADVTSALTLRANEGMACPGVQLSGQGFVVPAEMVYGLSTNARSALVRRYVTGRDLTQTFRVQFVLDTVGYTDQEIRREFPAVYQWLLDHVRPEREHNSREKYRREWWLHAEPRRRFRQSLSGLSRFIATSRTAKHRVFQFLSADYLPETKVLIVASDDAFVLGVLSSSLHSLFATTTGGWLGAGNDATYNHSECFDKFAFPVATPDQQARIRDLAEQLDGHRKRQQAQHSALTLTGLYNVLEKLRSGEPLSAKDKTIHEQGLVSVLKTLHDELDRAVLDAYGWSDLVPLLDGDAERFSETVLERLVALNAERAAEEARGLVRWLRPEFQHPAATALRPVQGELDTTSATTDAAGIAAPTRQPWPAALPEQVAAVARVLAGTAMPLTGAQIAARFNGRGPWKRRLPQLLETLVALGRARPMADGRYVAF